MRLPWVPLISMAWTGLPSNTNDNRSDTSVFGCGATAIWNSSVAKGFEVNLFADEGRFPQLVNPVQMQFDTKGRLWVAVWPSYPKWEPLKR